jgi:hypothetical protein
MQRKGAICRGGAKVIALFQSGGSLGLQRLASLKHLGQDRAQAEMLARKQRFKPTIRLDHGEDRRQSSRLRPSGKKAVKLEPRAWHVLPE